MYRKIITLLIASLMASVNYATEALNLEELTIKQAQALMSEGKLTSESLVNHYLTLIAKHDKNGVQLQSIAQINPNALTQAKQRDIERKEGNILGSLHGIPVLLKDNIDTVDHMANTAGSSLLMQHFPKHDAFLVKRLKQAGAIILGKTNLSQWANFRSTRSSSGWSALWGQAKNPYDINRSPCGSSSGSGVAVAANLTLVAIGTETDGSVTCPSSVNGIVGIKPTLGTVSRHGIIPIAHSQDTAGPMARTVTDAVVLLDALNAIDSNDSAAIKSAPNLVDHLITDGLKGKRIGVVRNLMGYHSDVDKLFDQQINVLKKQGAIIVDNANMPNIDKIGSHEFNVLLYEFKHGLNQYFKKSDIQLTLKSVIEKNQHSAQVEMPYFGQELFHMAQAKGDLSEQEYKTALIQAKLLAGEQGIDAVMNEYQLDVLIAPSTQPAWSIDWINGDHYLGAASTPAAVAGYPHITVPMGFIHHLPVGMSFFGRHLSEPILVEAAFAYEQASKARKPPKL